MMRSALSKLNSLEGSLRETVFRDMPIATVRFCNEFLFSIVISMQLRSIENISIAINAVVVIAMKNYFCAT